MLSQSALTRQILYHKNTSTKTKTKTTCPEIRRLYDTGLYLGIALPLQCERCLYHIASRDEPSFISWKWALERYIIDPCNRDIRAILRKEQGYEYVLNIFNQLFRLSLTGPILRRLHLSLIHLGVTMESLLHGVSQGFILDPNYPLIDFIESDTGVNVEWAVWVEENSAREKKEYLTFTRPYKEELIAATWEPSRFRRWCLDEEERKEVGTDFSARQAPAGHATSFQSALESH